MLRTGCGFGEIRGLRRCDIDLERKLLSVCEGAKNEHRKRTIPLSPKAIDSMQWILDRWRKLGGINAEDCILPHRAGKDHVTTDFSRPMYGINKGWNQIRIAWAAKAETPEDRHRRLTFRQYDMRVTAITKTLSTGKVSVHTAKRLFGHVSEAMQKRYYKPDLDTMRDAVNLLDGKPTEEKPPVDSPTPVIVIAPKSQQASFRERFRRSHRSSFRG
jgi:integrase